MDKREPKTISSVRANFQITALNKLYISQVLHLVADSLSRRVHHLRRSKLPVKFSRLISALSSAINSRKRV